MSKKNCAFCRRDDSIENSIDHFGIGVYLFPAQARKNRASRGLGFRVDLPVKAGKLTVF